MPSPDPNPGNYVAGLLIFTFSIGTMAASIRKWEEVRKERILRYVPHWDDLELSLSLSVAGECLLMVTFFIGLVRACYVGCANKRHLRGRFYLFAGFLYLATTIILFSAIGIYARFLPLNLSKCNDPKTWAVTQGRRENMFGFTEYGYLGHLDVGCRELVTYYILTVIAAILSSILCVYVLHYAATPHQVRGLNARLRHQKGLGLMANVKSIDDLELGVRGQGKDERGKTAANALEDALSTDKIVSSIAQNLHHYEILNLGLSSKAIYRALFSSSSADSRLELLRVRSCVRGQKSECWCCGSQICNGCKTRVSVKEASPTEHLKHCLAYCTKCHYSQVCARPAPGTAAWAKNYEVCKHHPISTELAQCLTPAQQDELKAVEEGTFHDLCATCSSRSVEQVESMRSARIAAEIRFLTCKLLRCTYCKKELAQEAQVGWGCALCKQDCRWDGHLRLRTNLDVRKGLPKQK